MMSSINPFGDFKAECNRVLIHSIRTNYSDFITNYRLGSPPNHDYGDLASSLCFELAKTLKKNPRILAEEIVRQDITLPKGGLIQKVESVGGYINFFADYPKFSRLTLESAQSLDHSYGYVRDSTPFKIIVEHTSVNPAGPIHIGTARNSFLGDSLHRILKARGHEVRVHFYVDDVGKQIAVLVYGYQMIKHIPISEKIDHWLGLVYAMTSCIIEIQALKHQLKQGGVTSEEAKNLQLELDDWASAATHLRKRDEKMFTELSNKIDHDEDPISHIAQIMNSYERGEPAIKALVRDVVDQCLQGFKETYDRMNIYWDSWDWESDLLWDGAVADVVINLEQTPYCHVVDGTLEFDANNAAIDSNLKTLLGIPKDHEIPPLVLKRSNGTSLYSTRDIAYSLWKISKADRVINVIGKEQTLAQTQIRIALSVLTSSAKAMNQMHYLYELVKLQGYRMSKRKGRYLTLDEILDEAEKRAWNEVAARSSDMPEQTKEAISKAVGAGAVKYALLSISPVKQVTFSWDKALNFEVNSAPFIQYAYARASNILKKASKSPKKIAEYGDLKEEVEKNLVRRIALFPEVFIDAAKSLTPNSIADFAYEIASSFNSFYASKPVLQAKPVELRNARLALVNCVRITIRNSMKLLGIDVLTRM